MNSRAWDLADLHNWMEKYGDSDTPDFAIISSKVTNNKQEVIELAETHRRAAYWLKQNWPDVRGLITPVWAHPIPDRVAPNEAVLLQPLNMRLSGPGVLSQPPPAGANVQVPASLDANNLRSIVTELLENNNKQVQKIVEKAVASDPAAPGGKRARKGGMCAPW